MQHELQDVDKEPAIGKRGKTTNNIAMYTIDDYEII